MTPEAASGVKGENSIKLFCNDLEALTRTANQIKEVLSTVRGITDNPHTDRSAHADSGFSEPEVFCKARADTGGRIASKTTYEITLIFLTAHCRGFDRTRVFTVRLPV